MGGEFVGWVGLLKEGRVCWGGFVAELVVVVFVCLWKMCGHVCSLACLRDGLRKE